MSNNFWKYYSLFDKNQYIDNERTVKELLFIKKWLPLRQYPKILDFGCGSGRISIPLSEDGYEMIGVDNNSTFIAEAKEEAEKNKLKIRFVNIDYRNFSSDDFFDAAIFIYSSFGYFDDKENLKLLKKIGKSIRKDGILILDNLNYFWVKNKPEGFWKDLTDRFSTEFLTEQKIKKVHRLRKMTQKEHFEETTYKVEYLSGKIDESSFKQRLFRSNELIDLLKLAGFKIEKFFGDFNFSDYSEDSSRIITIARKE